jgi:hypothetical protein
MLISSPKDKPPIIQIIESISSGIFSSFIGLIFPLYKFQSEALLDILKKVDPLSFFETTWLIIQAIPHSPGSKEILVYDLGHVLIPVIFYFIMLVAPFVISWLLVKNLSDKILSQYKILLTEIKEKPIFALLKVLCFTLPFVILGLRFYSVSTHTLYEL